MACAIVPPYILEALAKHASDDRVRTHARRTLELTRGLATKRSTPFEQPQPLASRGAGERRTVYDAEHDTTLPGKVVRRESDPPVSDAAVNEAYDNAGITYDFYEQLFDRRSVDGHDMRLVSSVHYSKHYDNAFWDGTQMVYGDGDGVVFGSFTRSLDVIAHELTHGFTQMSCGLAYHGESGALNESISDVFGSMVKQWHRRQTVEHADWLIGNDLLAGERFGRALRSLAAPGSAYNNIFMGGKDPQPANYRHYYRGHDDEGGVHVNSGIPNHAFYLTAMALGGHSWERAGHVWYDAVTSGLGVRCNFAHFAALTIACAQDRFGDDISRPVAAAWHHVGVDPKRSATHT